MRCDDTERGSLSPLAMQQWRFSIVTATWVVVLSISAISHLNYLQSSQWLHQSCANLILMHFTGNQTQQHLIPRSVESISARFDRLVIHPQASHPLSKFHPCQQLGDYRLKANFPKLNLHSSSYSKKNPKLAALN
mmetsp:Transcript_45711/g.73503  ORF Transcript_45711/g.73503 Transcript_45711/m.73503 type:complete len:135 (-) Transcript_45711:609-1013(-)